jgi:hypothetical protein
MACVRVTSVFCGWFTITGTARGLKGNSPEMTQRFEIRIRCFLDDSILWFP